MTQDIRVSARPARTGGAATHWHVYLLECADGTLYCGVTTDLARRLAQHNGLRPAGHATPADDGRAPAGEPRLCPQERGLAIGMRGQGPAPR